MKTELVMKKLIKFYNNSGTFICRVHLLVKDQNTFGQ